ncbi:MAG: ABC-F family ATP-binding cassette domain-containing protein [Myxococcales bacterium]|nr:ABC-F family ATP-binding cassette domain-containing protein [Myxococcales bacterium]
MIALTRVTKQYGRQILFVDASFQLNSGEKVGLVGPNGAGKTTVFRLIAGEETADEGEVSLPSKITMGYFKQDTGEVTTRSVLAETVAGAGEVAHQGEELLRLEHALADPEQIDRMASLLERFGETQARYQQLGGYQLEARAQEILAGLGFSQEAVAGEVKSLSGGWRMRVQLARILLMRPDVLLLDEPTNYLDLESILWLEKFIRDYPGAVLMTTHDRDFLNKVASKIVEIDGGALTSYSGNYDFYEQQRALAALQREAQYARQQAMLAKEMRFVERFKAQAAKAAQVQSRVKKLEKIELIELPRQQKEIAFEFRDPPRSGDDVVKIEHLSKRYGSRPIYDDFNLLVRRGERWAVMGENGAGKSTLLKMIAGALIPDAGDVTLGASLRMGYFAQHAPERESRLDSEGGEGSPDARGRDQTVLEALTDFAPTAGRGILTNLAAAFGFQGSDVEKPLKVLSGGERARLALAKLMHNVPNLLVLDEPTNHLDLATKAMLVRTLGRFGGTMIFVSHDRAFLRGLATRILELSPTGERRVYPGSYDEYVSSTGREAPGMRTT